MCMNLWKSIKDKFNEYVAFSSGEPQIFVDLDSMKKKELLDYAKSKGINANNSMTKKSIIELIYSV